VVGSGDLGFRYSVTETAKTTLDKKTSARVAKMLAVARRRVAMSYESEARHPSGYSRGIGSPRRGDAPTALMSPYLQRQGGLVDAWDRGGSVWAVWRRKGDERLTGAEWVEIAVLLHLRDGERAECWL
jgi:hypothetical protein